MDINKLITIVKSKLLNQIHIESINIEDKSFLHKNHKGNQEGKYHLKLIIVSEELKKMNKIESNKKIYKILDQELKEFNKNWNYFSGMNDNQIIDFLKSDMIWHKPTQSFSSSDNFFRTIFFIFDHKR